MTWDTSKLPVPKSSRRRDIEAIKLPVSCPRCQTQTTKTVGEFLADPHVRCVACELDFRAPIEEIRVDGERIL